MNCKGFRSLPKSMPLVLTFVRRQYPAILRFAPNHCTFTSNTKDEGKGLRRGILQEYK
jgi:hypothetical protein